MDPSPKTKGQAATLSLPMKFRACRSCEASLKNRQENLATLTISSRNVTTSTRELNNMCADQRG